MKINLKIASFMVVILFSLNALSDSTKLALKLHEAVKAVRFGKKMDTVQETNLGKTLVTETSVNDTRHGGLVESLDIKPDGTIASSSFHLPETTIRPTSVTYVKDLSKTPPSSPTVAVTVDREFSTVRKSGEVPNTVSRVSETFATLKVDEHVLRTSPEMTIWQGQNVISSIRFKDRDVFVDLLNRRRDSGAIEKTGKIRGTFRVPESDGEIFSVKINAAGDAVTVKTTTGAVYGYQVTRNHKTLEFKQTYSTKGSPNLRRALVSDHAVLEVFPARRSTRVEGLNDSPGSRTGSQ